MKKILNKFTILALTLAICFSSTLSPVNASSRFIDPISDANPVLDSHSADILGILHNYRMFSSNITASTSEKINLSGLNELNISGSSQFSRSNVDVINKSAHKFKVTVVDLRQESHGFINGLPISWENSLNDANKGLSKEEVIQKETSQLDTIKINKPFRIFNSSGSLIAKSVENENDFVKSNSMKYIRIPVTDGKLPTNDMVDYFVDFAKSQHKNSWLHFHCKEGIGRTSTFMIMYDTMKNYKNVSIDEIINRQLLLSTLSESNINNFKTDERLNFLNKFYSYVKENAPEYKVKWSDYIKADSPKAPN